MTLWKATGLRFACAHQKEGTPVMVNVSIYAAHGVQLSIQLVHYFIEFLFYCIYQLFGIIILIEQKPPFQVLFPRANWPP